MEIKTTSEIVRFRCSGQISIPEKKWVAVDDINQIMLEMEQASAKHPNSLQTYEVIWKKLKDEIQFCKKK